MTSLPPELSGATVRSPIVTTATVVETTRRKGTGGAQNDSSSDDSSYDSDFDLQHWDAYEDVTVTSMISKSFFPQLKKKICLYHPGFKYRFYIGVF